MCEISSTLGPTQSAYGGKRTFSVFDINGCSAAKTDLGLLVLVEFKTCR
jgi:hypothetical protein